MKKSCNRLTRTLLMGALAMAMTAPLSAQESTSSAAANAPVSEQVVSPEAQAVLDRMTAYLRTLQSFSIESNSTRDEVVSFGYKLQHTERLDMIVQRPDKLRSDMRGDLKNRTFVYNGNKLAMHSLDDDVYIRTAAPDSLGKLVGGVLDAGVDMPLIDVLYQASTGSLTEGVRSGILVGESIIDGVAHYHLAFRQATVDWQLWVKKGAQPLPSRIVITTRYEVGDPQYQANLRWNLKPAIDDKTFVFTPPEGATEIPFNDQGAIASGAQ